MVSTTLNSPDAALDCKKAILLGSSACGKTSLMNRKKGILKIWSTGGHERYRALLGQFYANINVAVLCFDMLCDDADSIVVKQQDGNAQALDWNIEFRAVSAKSGAGVSELFEYIADL
ncbi:hypothetical protein HDU82_001994 [Entophlyctis luteolus]|nr:hypothetical protein HDU82_001994 [Entophlyctis luteolus]